MTENQIKILKMLDWNNPMEVKREGLILSLKEEDCSFLIRPNGYYNSWEVCGDVLPFIEDKRLAPFVFELMEWALDLNIAGADKADMRLRQMNPEYLRGAKMKIVFNESLYHREEWQRFFARLASRTEYRRS